MGMHDGVSRLWIMRARGGLQIEGFRDEVEAIGDLIRHALTFGPPETRAKIEAAYADAIKHLEDEESEPARKAATPMRGPFVPHRPGE